LMTSQCLLCGATRLSYRQARSLVHRRCRRVCNGVGIPRTRSHPRAGCGAMGGFLEVFPGGEPDTTTSHRSTRCRSTPNEPTRHPRQSGARRHRSPIMLCSRCCPRHDTRHPPHLRGDISAPHGRRSRARMEALRSGFASAGESGYVRRSWQLDLPAGSFGDWRRPRLRLGRGRPGRARHLTGTAHRGQLGVRRGYRCG